MKKLSELFHILVPTWKILIFPTAVLSSFLLLHMVIHQPMNIYVFLFLLLSTYEMSFNHFRFKKYWEWMIEGIKKQNLKYTLQQLEHSNERFTNHENDGIKNSPLTLTKLFTKNNS